MSWYTQMLTTLDALESRANPTTEQDIQQLAKLGTALETLTAGINGLNATDKAEAEPHLATLMLRIQGVMNILESNRNSTSHALTQLRQRQHATRAYQSK